MNDDAQPPRTTRGANVALVQGPGRRPGRRVPAQLGGEIGECEPLCQFMVGAGHEAGPSAHIRACFSACLAWVLGLTECCAPCAVSPPLPGPESANYRRLRRSYRFGGDARDVPLRPPVRS
jgi:hypothetical protein